MKTMTAIKFNLAIFFSVLFLNTVLSQKNTYKEGYYIDGSRNKKQGFIKVVDGSRIKYKSKIKSKKSVLKSDDIKGFSINDCKYRVLYNFSAKSRNVIFPTKFSSGFFREIILGEISLYEYIVSTNNGMMHGTEGYYFVQKGNKPPIQVPFSKKKIRELIMDLMSDKNDFLKQQELNKIKYKNVGQIIKSYNES